MQLSESDTCVSERLAVGSDSTTGTALTRRVLLLRLRRMSWPHLRTNTPGPHSLFGSLRIGRSEALTPDFPQRFVHQIRQSRLLTVSSCIHRESKASSTHGHSQLQGWDWSPGTHGEAPGFTVFAIFWLCSLFAVHINFL